MKDCAICGKQFDNQGTAKKFCSPECTKEGRKANREKCKDWYRDYYQKKLYNVSQDELEAVRSKADGKCMICGVSEKECHKGLHLDHDHVSGRVRGLLCSKCNKGLGLFQDNAELLMKAAGYLYY